MKKIIILFLGCISFGSISAQWTTNGNNIYNSNSGNVGIGTTNPQSLLDVSGQLRIGKTGSAGRIDFARPGDGNYQGSLGWATDEILRQYFSGGSSSYRISSWINNQLTDVVTVNNNGNVGIGTTSPSEKLTLQGNMLIDGVSYPKIQLSNRLMLQVPIALENSYTRSFVGQNIAWNGTTNKWSVSDQVYSDFSMMRFENSGTISFYNKVNAGAQPELSNGELEAYRRMTIDYYGNVGIGTTAPQGYKLAVNGDAIFTKAKVKLFANWPDYVFHYTYRLRPLAELEKFIEQNKHLPDVPSAAEVEKNGLDLGDNQALLLKKIEELTLYVIELKKENEQQQKEIQALKNNQNKK